MTILAIADREISNSEARYLVIREISDLAERIFFYCELLMSNYLCRLGGGWHSSCAAYLRNVIRHHHHLYSIIFRRPVARDEAQPFWLPDLGGVESDRRGGEVY
jgi:hypothetical protein